MFRYEKEMTPIVAQWLIDHGLMVRKEMYYNSGPVDLTACWNYQYLYAIELKLSRISEVLKQARRNAVNVTESYIAMPQGIATKVWQRVDTQGVGVISVSREGCKILKTARHLEHKPFIVFVGKEYRTHFHDIVRRFRRYGNNLPKGVE